MSDFETALKAHLDRNAELAAQRRQAEDEFERWQAQQTAEAQERERQLAEARVTRHAALATHLQALAAQLKASSPEHFVVRQGWTHSGDEFITKISTRIYEPARTLFIELDRDDDEVLVRWTSDVGKSLELWRVLEVEPELLTEIVLQIADQELWQHRRTPPAFPGRNDED